MINPIFGKMLGILMSMLYVVFYELCVTFYLLDFVKLFDSRSMLFIRI